MTARSALDLIVETTTTEGTGTLTLAGALTGFLALPSGANGQTFGYSLEDGNGNSRETGVGVYTHSGRTFTRSVIASTNANAAINLSSGTHLFRICPLADLFSGLTGNIQTQINDLLSITAFDSTTAVESVTSTSWVDTSLSVTVTPKTTSDKVLVRAMIKGGGDHSIHVRLADGSGTPLAQGDTSSNRARTHANLYRAGTSPTLIQEANLEWCHSPASTSAQTYKLQWRKTSAAGTIGYINRAADTFSDNDAWPVCVSTLFAEVLRA